MKAMKKWMRWTMTALCACALSAGVAAAQTPTAVNRQIAQQKRIGQGVKSGELTKAETLRLERNAARIRRSTVKDRADQGVFTPKERAKAQKKLDRQSKAIARQKHDSQDR
jgi:hypothetical protein